MARLVVGAVGAAAGFFLGGPAGASLGWTLGSAVGGLLEPPIESQVSGPRLGDLKVQFSSYGNMVPIIYGTMRIAGNVIWASDLIETSSTTSQHSGKGGGGGQTTTTTSYSYSINLAISLCEGPITGIRRVWANGQLVYNFGDSVDINTLNDTQAALKNLTVYTGTESQLADPVMEAALGAGNVPAYRGQAYVVFEGLQLEKYGNRVPNLEFEVVGTGGSVSRPSLVNTGLRSYNSVADRTVVQESGQIWAQSNNTLPGKYSLYDLKTGTSVLTRNTDSGLVGERPIRHHSIPGVRQQR